MMSAVWWISAAALAGTAVGLGLAYWRGYLAPRRRDPSPSPTFNEPEPPRNVRIETRHGEIIPVECVYDGIDDMGQHNWIACAPVAVDPRGMRLDADVLPGNTNIEITVVPE